MRLHVQGAASYWDYKQVKILEKTSFYKLPEPTL